jgi:hypothetical protein
MRIVSCTSSMPAVQISLQLWVHRPPLLLLLLL